MSLCRYETYIPQAGRQKRWGWHRTGVINTLDEQEVARAILASDAGLLPLAELARSDELPLSELDVQPGHYGIPSLVAPILSNQEVWAAGVTYESSKFAR